MTVCMPEPPVLNACVAIGVLIDEFSWTALSDAFVTSIGHHSFNRIRIQRIDRR